MKRLPYLILAAVIAALDALTKWLIVARLDLHDAVTVIPGFLQLVHVRNSGAAFGIGAGSESAFVPLLLNAGAVTVLCVVVIYSLRASISERALQTGLHLIIGGAIGNLVDRFRFGYVVDFADVFVGEHHWPAFNVADSAICVGIGLLFLDMKQRPEETAALTVPAGEEAH